MSETQELCWPRTTRIYERTSRLSFAIGAIGTLVATGKQLEGGSVKLPLVIFDTAAFALAGIFKCAGRHSRSQTRGDDGPQPIMDLAESLPGLDLPRPSENGHVPE